MGWADRAIALLGEGEEAVIRPRGHSMRPLVRSGATVTLEPIRLDALQIGDIVLCKVSGHTYLHKVTALQGGRVQIGNNRGRINGWTRAVYGRATQIDNG